MYNQQQSLQYKQQVPGVVAYGQQSSFQNPQSSFNQLNHMPTQMTVTSQVPINQNQITQNPTSIGGVVTNPLGSCLHMSQMNQINGVPNAGVAMQSQMV